jgi:hypothetical protein
VTRRRNNEAPEWDGNADYLLDRPPNPYEEREAFRAWLMRQTLPIWLTLSYSIPRDAIHKDALALDKPLRRFANRLCQKAYGKSRLRAGCQRPIVFGFLEHPNSNKHVNLLINADDAFLEALVTHGDKLWRKLCKSRGFFLEIVREKHKVIGYVTKEQLRGGLLSATWVYPPSVSEAIKERL